MIRCRPRVRCIFESQALNRLGARSIFTPVTERCGIAQHLLQAVQTLAASPRTAPAWPHRVPHRSPPSQLRLNLAAFLADGRRRHGDSRASATAALVADGGPQRHRRPSHADGGPQQHHRRSSRVRGFTESTAANTLLAYALHSTGSSTSAVFAAHSVIAARQSQITPSVSIYRYVRA